MKILSGTGDCKSAGAGLRVYGYFKDDVGTIAKAMEHGIAKHIGSQLRGPKNGPIRFLSERGVWYSFIKLDDGKGPTAESFRRFGANAVKEAGSVSAKDVAAILPPGHGVPADDAAGAVVQGAVLGIYNYSELKTSDSDGTDGFGGKGRSMSICRLDGARIAQGTIDRARLVAEATNEARRLADAPSNMMTPAIFTDIVGAKARKEGIKVRVLDKSRLEAMGWGAFLGVARGSFEPPKVLVLEYSGAKGPKRYAVVGKGITFDSGGISIKPSSGMEDMKFDIAGAAAVAMTTILAARLTMPLNIVAVMPLTENMPGGRAQKPGDVVKTLSGKTVEIISTDAEGRMILADALSYVVKTYRPEAVIDLATLTGACVVALGSEASGIMGTDDGLVDALIDAGEQSGDRLWKLPLWDDYKDLLKSDVADMKNAGSRWAGAIQGGIFLKEFVQDAKWAHVDIAGTAYLDKPRPYFRKGATGAGVRLLIKFFEGLH